VIIANSNLVPRWADWDHFDELDRAGLMMYGQMTAGSWIYIGTQGILQGTYETFASAANLHFGGSLAGTVTVTAGLGGMGGAQPLAIALAGGVALCVEVDPTRIQRRLDTRYLDEVAATSTTPSSGPRPPSASAAPAPSACSATPPRCCRPWWRAASRPTSSPTRPAPTTRATATSRRCARTRTPRTCASATRRATWRACAAPWPSTCAPS
jgi:hypothetical protein